MVNSKEQSWTRHRPCFASNNDVGDWNPDGDDDEEKDIFTKINGTYYLCFKFI